MSKIIHSLETPMYPPSMAGRLVGLPYYTAYRWLRGYKFSYEVQKGEKTKKTHQRPVIKGKDSRYATFLELIDLLFVKNFLKQPNISLQKIRQALIEIEKILGDSHFARKKFFSDGKNIYMEIKDRQGEGKNIMQLLSGGQWVIAPVIEKIYPKIDFDEQTEFAFRWYPQGREKSVVIDPRISFGLPSIKSRGIKTSNIYDLYKAENKSIEAVSEWYEIKENEVLDAIKYEESLLVAA